MSLEKAIQENTAAVLGMAALMRSAQALVTADAAPAKVAAAPAKVAAAPAGKPAADKAKGPTYDAVKAATSALAKAKGRDAALKVLSDFGVSNGTELGEEQWADYIAKANEAATAEDEIA